MCFGISFGLSFFLIHPNIVIFLSLNFPNNLSPYKPHLSLTSSPIWFFCFWYYFKIFSTIYTTYNSSSCSCFSLSQFWLFYPPFATWTSFWKQHILFLHVIYYLNYNLFSIRLIMGLSKNVEMMILPQEGVLL